jgi:hypothetical protein
MATAGLSSLAEALRIVDARADLNRRYRKLIDDAREVLDSTEIRVTQARGIAKKLLVPTKAAGPDLVATLAAQERERLDAGLTQARDLIRESAEEPR